MRLCTLALATVLAVESGPAEEGAWRADVLIESEHGMGGAAIGDLDPECPGNEIVAVNAAGEVWMARRTGDGWRSERIYKGDGELIMCAIGDVDPKSPGNEFVAVGMVRGPESNTGPGHVLIIRRDSGSWRGQTVFTDDRMIHGVAIGDVCSRHAGQEIIAAGFNHRVTLLCRDESDAWCSETIFVANDRLKIALVGDVLFDRDGPEVLVCGSDGTVAAVWPASLGWRHEVVFSGGAGRSRIAIGEAGVLVGGDDGTVTLVSRHASTWETEFLGREPGKIRGVAIADVDQPVPGFEYYATGYARSVVQYYRTDEGFWSNRVIYRDEKPLHHLVAGDVDPIHPGDELITCGHGGRLILLMPER